ncbi:hypothetical protein HNY73_012218 [Argiope bruennichi]|uniref:Uncharacterized protein n=1 Tax=Argiope bruennichi TaxID=94029 RepID=A0A8T0EU95_ARGBR|nr:hypothetical protein HNY73_012218 [Argiope bruennichi]
MQQLMLSVGKESGAFCLRFLSPLFLSPGELTMKLPYKWCPVLEWWIFIVQVVKAWHSLSLETRHFQAGDLIPLKNNFGKDGRENSGYEIYHQISCKY